MHFRDMHSAASHSIVFFRVLRTLTKFNS